MKITKVQVFRLVGREKTAAEVFEADHPYLTSGNQLNPHEAFFTEVMTDEGVSGLCIGGSNQVKELGELLIGEDPLRIEYLWEKMSNWRYARYGHLHDMGILDLALWDLVGKIRNAPVYELLGGHVREKVPAYAAMLGYSLKPELAAERSLQYVNEGFKAVKWYLGFNEKSEIEGIRHNLALVEAVRKAVGSEVKILLDFANSKPMENSFLYMAKLAQQLEQYDITWLEEPLYYEDMPAYEKLSRLTSIPLACGEHLYTRSQIKQFLERGAISVYQPDCYFAQGLTEMRRMMGLLSSYGATVIPHANESCLHTAHLLFNTVERTSPMAEFGMKLNLSFQHFFKEFYEPRSGYFERPKGPGFGYEIDPDKIINKDFL
jgi:L-rhamnonate dehydratase